MDKAEAREVAAGKITELRELPYEALIDQFLDKPRTSEVTGRFGTTYQLEIEAFWDDDPDSDLRVCVLVDDGAGVHSRRFSSDSIVAPDGSFVGE